MYPGILIILIFITVMGAHNSGAPGLVVRPSMGPEQETTEARVTEVFVSIFMLYVLLYSLAFVTVPITPIRLIKIPTMIKRLLGPSMGQAMSWSYNPVQCSGKWC